MCYFPRNFFYHKLSVLNNKNLLSHSSGDKKSEFKMLAGLVPSKSSEEESILYSIPLSFFPPSVHSSVSKFPHYIKSRVILD